MAGWLVAKNFVYFIDSGHFISELGLSKVCVCNRSGRFHIANHISKQVVPDIFKGMYPRFMV